MAKPKIAIPKGSVAELDALLEQDGMGGRGRRSSLSRWLRNNHDEFAAMLATKDPGWDKVAVGLGKMGLLDGGGKPPTGARVRKVWWETRRDRCAAQPAIQAAGDIAPAVRAVPAGEQDGDNRPRPIVPPGIHAGTSAAVSGAGQLHSEPSSSLASPEVVTLAGDPDPTSSIPDQKQDRDTHSRRMDRQMDVAALAGSEEPSGTQGRPDVGSDQLEVARADALAEASPALPSLQPALAPQPIVPSTRNAPAATPGKKLGALEALKLWKRSPQGRT
ncbi:MAG: hypothetical protein ACRYHQ_19505 [Janthinobacterium lividum]